MRKLFLLIMSVLIFSNQAGAFSLTCTGLNNMSWCNMSAPTSIISAIGTFSFPNATGGTITTSGNYTIHTFTSNGTFIPNGNYTIEVLVVAGGGGGSASGAGAGGYVYNNSYFITNQSYPVIVGIGGPGSVSAAQGVNGTNSTFDTITAIKGAGGAAFDYLGVIGGSGSGGTCGTAPCKAGGSGTPGQGNAGGNGTKPAYDIAGGGGGFGSKGHDANATHAGDGGDGQLNNISGSDIIYSCGGGGAADARSGAIAGVGGCTNAGNGSNTGTGGAGVDGTGSGGGGGGWDSGYKTGGKGANGTVIIRYLTKKNTTVWIQPTDHPTSEIKATDTNPISVNLSITPLNLMQNIQLFSTILTEFNITIDYEPDLPLQLLAPANTSATTSPVSLSWQEWPTSGTSTYQVSTDNQFINIVTSGTALYSADYYNATISLDPGIYYWRAKTNGSYSDWFTFTISAPAATPGRLNITAFDEVTGAQLPTFFAQVSNLTTVLNKSAVGGWANFSESEVIAGEYIIRVVPNSSYASRQVMATSPANVSLYLPATTNTIDTIAFYLLDYTNIFPWKSSVLSITKNNSVMHSSYFDADAKVATYLIRGESYGVSVSKGDNIQNWGNYISIASGNVEVVIMDIGVNSTLRNPFVYNVTWSSSNITLQWSDSFDVMSNINYSIFKGSSKTLVHQLITSVDHGSSEYIVTNTSDVYYVSVSALTTNGYRNQSYIIDYRAGSSATESESPDLYTWSYGSVVIPPWVKNAFAVMSLAILAGCFGALHRGEGAIITGIMALVFWKWTWLSAVGAGIGFLGAMVLFAILYHLDSKRKGGGYF